MSARVLPEDAAVTADGDTLADLSAAPRVTRGSGASSGSSRRVLPAVRSARQLEAPVAEPLQVAESGSDVVAIDMSGGSGGGGDGGGDGGGSSSSSGDSGNVYGSNGGAVPDAGVSATRVAADAVGGGVTPTTGSRMVDDLGSPRVGAAPPRDAVITLVPEAVPSPGATRSPTRVDTDAALTEGNVASPRGGGTSPVHAAAVPALGGSRSLPREGASAATAVDEGSPALGGSRSLASPTLGGSTTAGSSVEDGPGLQRLAVTSHDAVASEFVPSPGATRVDADTAPIAAVPALLVSSSLPRDGASAAAAVGEASPALDGSRSLAVPALGGPGSLPREGASAMVGVPSPALGGSRVLPLEETEVSIDFGAGARMTPEAGAAAVADLLQVREWWCELPYATTMRLIYYHPHARVRYRCQIMTWTRRRASRPETSHYRAPAT